MIVEQSEKEAEAEAATEDTSDREESLRELIALLNELPDPMVYLAEGTAKESILDRDQLANARTAVDSWLAGEEEASSGSAEEREELQSLILRLEGLEHIRDTETDCLDVDCPYHYPEIIQQQMAQDETPELLTLDDLVEEYGVEPPMQTFSRLRSASVPHPQTLMLTEDNENNSHTGSSDGDIDKILSNLDGNHPIEMSFTLTEVPTQSAYLAVKAYDVDEERGETDYVYINDDIFLEKNQRNSYKQRYNASTIGYLSGTNNTWNTTILSIPLEKLKVGKNTISVTIASGWVVKVDWMQLILDGGAEDSNIQEFSLKLEDSATSGDNVTVQSSVTVRQTGNVQYTTEYTLTQNETGNALDACFGTVSASETIELVMPLSSPSGVYTITGILKDSGETIKATDSISFYFTQGVGLGPRISHTLDPDSLTNQEVTIAVSAQAIPEAGITEVSVPATKTVKVNGSYSFTVNYTQDGEERHVTYTVNVDNIDKQAPVITYSPISVLQDEAYDTVKKLFADALSVTDTIKLASEPLSYTIPQDISKTPGTKTISVTASDAAGNTTTKNCAITVTAKPVRLTIGELKAVSGSKDSYTLNAVLDNGSDQITETGFVWGVMPNPTLELNNGSVKTASVVKATGQALTGTATGLLSGVEYYARAYAKVTENSKTNVVYSDAEKFGFGIPSYGTFSVSGVSGSIFTVTRTGGTDGAQTVYYRTVNGSAIGGTHFTHQAGTLTFADGQTSKTVTVTELGVTKAYNNDAGTQYSNADRTYSLEI
ncbi:MAG: Calx-beta domain-containing protein, partial [Candidatus Cryptobacteroides sp.]